MIDLGPFANKTIDFAYCGSRLKFDLSHALFSSFDVDSGTRFLLKELAHEESILGARSILDAGCGVGIIGISLAAACPGARVVMTDRDLLACAFAERNCRRNRLAVASLGIEMLNTNPEEKSRIFVTPGLLGEEDPLGPYDAVVSNLPAKAGAEVLSRFLKKAADSLLNPGGILAFVIVNTLAGLAGPWIDAAGLSLTRSRAGPGHTVFVTRKTGPAAPLPDQSQSFAAVAASTGPTVPSIGPAQGLSDKARGIDFYVRSSGPRSIGRYVLEASGFQGLAEFDTNSFATDLAVETLERAAAGCLVRDFLVVEPGIGLSALWACRSMGPERVHLLSRDYLSLIASSANLAARFPRVACLPRASTEADSLPPGFHRRGTALSRYHAPDESRARVLEPGCANSQAGGGRSRGFGLPGSLPHRQGKAFKLPEDCGEEEEGLDGDRLLQGIDSSLLIVSINKTSCRN